MPRDNGSNRYDGRGNKYDQGNRYQGAAPPPEPEATPNTLPVPAVRPSQGENDWRARRAPEVMVYEPLLGDAYGRRSKAKRLSNDLAIATQVAQAGAQFYQAAQRVEQSKQDLELAHERRALVPLKVTQERMGLEQQLLKAAGDFEAAREDREIQRTDRVRRRRLDEQDFQIAVLAREAAQREQEARIAAAEAQLAYASDIGQRRGEADLARVEADALRHQSDAEGERRRLREERRKSREVGPAEADELPAPLARHLKTERAVKRNVNEAARRAQGIRAQAAEEGRELTAEEIESIDVLEDAATAAEGSIRRGEASDLEA